MTLLDARPDRIDFRDRAYQPKLVSLPPRYPTDWELTVFLENYRKCGMIRDQKQDGACTGFGLAAVINYLNWLGWLRRELQPGVQVSDLDFTTAPARVSPWMLYNLARLYDEWEGENYSGSSCRGAMKGWHKHGVCDEQSWRSTHGARAGWEMKAAEQPLGAYFRVNALSIADMQAAIHEVGAIYCSARVHPGWWFDRLSAEPELVTYTLQGHNCLPVIPLSDATEGGHAFALMGYTERGFIIQNSWGPSWGTEWGAQATKIPGAPGGFAILSYEDWAMNGQDAWVAALAAPMMISGMSGTIPSSNSRSSQSLLERAAQTRARNHMFGLARANQPTRKYWTEEKAYDHSVVMGNDGMPIRRRVDSASAAADMRETIGKLVRQHPGRDVVIYAHGGLNSEKAAIRRAQMLGPWFEENDILPIFIVWRTGFMDALADIGSDLVENFLEERMRAERSGILDALGSIRKRLETKFDTAFEAVAEKVMGKAVWSQIKQNAQAASETSAARQSTGGMRLLANVLKSAMTGRDQTQIHLMGHSAGSILLGHFAEDLVRFTKLGSVILLAPACTLGFANVKFRPLVEKQHLAADKLRIVNLSRENERADTVGPYHKSLLYLVSRAFEAPRKSPLLGLDDCWILPDELLPKKTAIPSQARVDDPATHARDLYDALSPFYALAEPDKMRAIAKMTDVARKTAAVQKLPMLRTILDWRTFMATSGVQYEVCLDPAAKVKHEGQIKKYDKVTHGNIDNDIDVMNRAILHMTGKNKVKITDLTGA